MRGTSPAPTFGKKLYVIKSETVHAKCRLASCAWIDASTYARKQLRAHLRFFGVRHLTLQASPSRLATGDDMDNIENIAVVRQFIDACVRADADEVAEYFTEDAVWWNAPWQPISGREAIREAFRRGTQGMAGLPWRIRHIVADAGVVLTERVDNFMIGETRVCVPCMGIFELCNGKIAAWRDYWDLQQYERQLPTRK